MRGGWRSVVALLVLVPATGLALGSHFADRRAGWRQPWQEPAMVELRQGLPRNALLVVPPGDLDTPVFLARDAFDMDKFDGLVRGYDPIEMARRHALVDTLYRAGRLEPALSAALEATGRPAYAVWPDQAQPWQARTPGLLLRKFSSGGPRRRGRWRCRSRCTGRVRMVTPLTREHACHERVRQDRPSTRRSS